MTEGFAFLNDTKKPHVVCWFSVSLLKNNPLSCPEYTGIVANFDQILYSNIYELRASDAASLRDTFAPYNVKLFLRDTGLNIWYQAALILRDEDSEP